MADPHDAETPTADVLIAVFADDQVDLVRRTLDQHGRGADGVRVGDDTDLRWSLRAEQTEETDRSLMAPHAGAIMPKEATKAAGIAVPVGSAIGAVLCLPFAAIGMGDLNVGLRLFWCAVVGAALGGTIAYIVSTAMAAKDTFEPNAAQRGVVIRVVRPTPAIESAVAGLAPIRIDHFTADGVVTGAVTTEEERQPGGVIEEVAANVKRELEADPAERHR